MDRFYAWLRAHPGCNVEVEHDGDAFNVTLYDDYGERFDGQQKSFTAAVAEALDAAEQAAKERVE